MHFQKVTVKQRTEPWGPELRKGFWWRDSMSTQARGGGTEQRLRRQAHGDHSFPLGSAAEQVHSLKMNS